MKNRYWLGLDAIITLGVPCDFERVRVCQLKGRFPVDTITANALPGMFTLNSLTWEGVNVIATDNVDPSGLNPSLNPWILGSDRPALVFPSLSVGGSVLAKGKYTGHVPEGYRAGEKFTLVITLSGIVETIDCPTVRQ